MELKELCDKTLEIFEASNTSELSEKLLDVCVSNNFEKLSEFKNIVKDLNVDWLQKIFQYYEADRKGKKQDYTPKSLASLVAALTTDDEIIDYCAGSGALTIQTWRKHPNASFVCYELDTKVLPYLIFNLQVRNITAKVINADVLANEVYKVFELTKSEEFSIVKELSECQAQ